MIIEQFEDALADLVMKGREGGLTRDQLISSLELQLMALKDLEEDDPDG